MSKLNITISVPVSEVADLINSLPDGAVLLSAGSPQDFYEAAAGKCDPASVPPKAKVEKDGPSYQKHTNAFEVYAAAKGLYGKTQKPFRTSDVWHALKGRGVNATVGTVAQHLWALRSMGLLDTVGGARGPGGYVNVVSRWVEEDDFNARYREHLAD